MTDPLRQFKGIMRRLVTFASFIFIISFIAFFWYVLLSLLLKL